MLKKLQKHLRGNRYVFLIIGLGTLIWSLTMIKSGVVYDFGIGFWGPNGHDGVWHISIARSLSEGSLELPIFSGSYISNYHIGFDVILAMLNRLTFIPISTLYFQIIPPMLAATLGYLIFKFLKNLKFDNQTIVWSLFFVYFGGNLGWLVTLLRDGSIGGGSMFWAQANIQTLVNPPYALSLCVIMLGLILLQKNRHLLAGLVFGLLIQIKAYAAVIVFISLLLSFVYFYYQKKQIKLLKTIFIFAVVSTLIFLPFNDSSTSLFVFKPFWFLETMMSFPDRVGWQRFGEAMVNYKLAGNLIKGIAAYAIAFFIFWYGNLGTRLIAELYVLKFKSKKPVFFEVFFIASILTGVLIPMMFVQKGTAWNTIQFFYYSIFFASILTGVVFAGAVNRLKSLVGKITISVAMILFTIPTTYEGMKHYLPPVPPAMISNQEIKALSFLQNQADGIVLVAPFDRNLGQYAPAPRPLYLYESTSYVSAYTGKKVFLEDEVNLDITGFDWQERIELVKKYLKTQDREFLVNNNITYIYLPKVYGYKLDLPVIFENDEITIFKVK